MMQPPLTLASTRAKGSGVVLGKFLPPHLGHVHLVDFARHYVDDLTVLVGENGTGKSTIIEAVAMAYGLGAEGGSVNGRDSTWASESPLHESLQLVRGGGASRWGYFLRAETMHGMFTYLQSSGPERDFHSRSHGEAFWDIVTTSRFADGGLFVLDEPEAALS